MKTKSARVILKHFFCLVLLGGSLFVVFSLTSQTAYAEDSTLLESQKGFGSGEPIRAAFGNEADTDVRLIVARVIKVILGFLGLIFVVLILMAGFKWMTAEGNEEKIKEASTTIRNAIIGLVIIIASYGITDFIMETITDSDIKW